MNGRKRELQWPLLAYSVEKLGFFGNSINFGKRDRCNPLFFIEQRFHGNA